MEQKYLQIVSVIFFASMISSGCTTPASATEINKESQAAIHGNEVNQTLEVDDFYKTETIEMPGESNMIYISPHIIDVKMNEEFSLKISVNNISDLFGMPFYLVYDPKLLQFVSAKEGPFLGQDGNSTLFVFFNNTNLGSVIVCLTRLGQVKGISGSGTVMSINFKAVGISNTSIVFNKASAKKTTSKNLVPQLFPVTFRGAQININEGIAGNWLNE